MSASIVTPDTREPIEPTDVWDVPADGSAVPLDADRVRSESRLVDGQLWERVSKRHG